MHPLDRALEAVLPKIERSAKNVDDAGIYPFENMEILRDAGLLAAAFPTEMGGMGIGIKGQYVPLYELVEQVATACSSTAQLLFVQNIAISTIMTLGIDAQIKYFSERVRSGAAFCYLGSEPNERFSKDNARVYSESTAHAVEGGFVLNAKKAFATGSMGSDYALVVCLPEGSANQQDLMVLAVPMKAAGVEITDSWNNMGQRATTSGLVNFRDCFVPNEMVIGRPGALVATRIFGSVFQLGFAAILTGIGQGAVNFAIDYARNFLKPTVGYDQSVDEPNIQGRIGWLAVRVEASRSLIQRAASLLQKAEENEIDIREVQIAVYQAKTMASRTAVEVSSEIFDICGARATAKQVGADRFWRNARTMSLHDNLDRQFGIIGRHLLGVESPQLSTR